MKCVNVRKHLKIEKKQKIRSFLIVMNSWETPSTLMRALHYIYIYIYIYVCIHVRFDVCTVELQLEHACTHLCIAFEFPKHSVSPKACLGLGQALSPKARLGLPDK